jgi:hypothetical protein
MLFQFTGANVVLFRNLISKAKWKPINEFGYETDVTTLNDPLLVVTTYGGTDEASIIRSYTDLAIDDQNYLYRLFTLEDLITLPVGTYGYELAAGVNGEPVQSLFQGSFTVNVNIIKSGATTGGDDA